MAENAHTQATDGVTPLQRAVRAGEAVAVKLFLRGTILNFRAIYQ